MKNDTTMTTFNYFRLFALSAALLAGCSRDPETEVPVGPGSGRTVAAAFELGCDFEQAVEVKADGTEDVTTIHDVWAIQLAPDGQSLLQLPVYLTELTPKNGDYRITFDLLDADSKIVFVANTHDASAYASLTTTSTVADVAALAMSVAAEGDLTANGVPMSGSWLGSALGINGVPGRVGMTRAVSKVTFNLGANLPAGDSYTVQSVQVKQVPATLDYYRDDASLNNTPYPDLAAAGTIDYAAQTLSGVGFVGGEISPVKQTFMWYIPENARGAGTAADQFHKTGATAPAGQGDWCTYVEIRGSYYNHANGTGYTTIYRIFLGGDNTSDYNLLRNRAYTVDVTLCGQSTADTRIEVQDYLDYTDNGRSWFVLAPANNPAGMVNWATALTVCPSGWRLFSQNEAMVTYSYRPALGSFLDFNYGFWTSTEAPANRAWYFSGNSSLIIDVIKTSPALVRCVKGLAAGGTTYPYVAADGRTIVSRDADGGVKEAALLTAAQKAWLTTTNTSDPGFYYTDDGAYNRVSPKFQVAAADAGVSRFVGAYSLCRAYGESGAPAGSWRMPTLRELMLMYVLKGGLTGISAFTAAEYWSSTSGSSNSQAYYVGLGDGYMYSHEGYSYSYRIRCVRDVN